MLQDLPVEILNLCFKHLSRLPGSRENLEACRLTSKYLSEIVAPILIHHVSVHLSFDLLARLEEISQHPLIAKSVRTVEINLSFYDGQVAKDFSLFAKCRASELSRATERFHLLKNLSKWRPYTERSKEEPKESEKEFERVYTKGCQAKSEWDAVVQEDYDWENLTPHQMILQEAHLEYCRRFNDQELAKQNNAHLDRISVALQQFIGLKGIVLSDNPKMRRLSQVEKLNTTIQEKFKLSYQSKFSDSELKSNCLMAFCWKVELSITDTTTPPTQLIPDVFATLEHSAIFPREFTISISAPNDLRILQMSSDQLCCISHVLSKATKLSFSVDSWAWGDRSYGDNFRPYDEMQHLGKLTSAFFNTKSLESLKLSFTDYLCADREISLGQILPLQTQTWPHLRTLVLRTIPFNQHELRALARKTVRNLELSCPYLLSGLWLDLVEYLRSLDNLEQVNFYYLKGRKLGDDPREYRGYNIGGQVAEYVLRKREDNPLQGFQSSQPWEEVYSTF